MPFCDQCGANLLDDDQFCSACGAQVSTTSPVPRSAEHPAPKLQSSVEERVPIVKASGPKGGTLRKKALTIGVVVILVFAGLTAYGVYLNVLHSNPNQPSGLMAGAGFYNGPEPSPGPVEYMLPNGTTTSVEAVQGWAIVIVPPSTALAAVNTTVTGDGGSLLSYIPAAGFYLASTGSQNESAFTSKLDQSSLVNYAGPDWVSTRDSPIGNPYFIDQAPVAAASQLEQAMAGTSSDVVMVLVDSFDNPQAHGFEVAGVLKAKDPQLPFFEVEDQPSDCRSVCIVDMQKSIGTILAVIGAAQQAKKKVVINFSTAGQCTGAAGPCDNADAWYQIETEVLRGLAGAINPSASMGNNVVICQAAGNQGADISQEIQNLKSAPTSDPNVLQDLTPLLDNNVMLTGMLSSDGQSLSQTPSGTIISNHANGGVIFTTPASDAYAAYTSYAAPICSADAYTLWSQNSGLSSSQVLQAFRSGASTGPSVSGPAGSGYTLPVLSLQGALATIGNQNPTPIPLTTSPPSQTQGHVYRGTGTIVGQQQSGDQTWSYSAQFSFCIDTQAGLPNHQSPCQPIAFGSYTLETDGVHNGIGEGTVQGTYSYADPASTCVTTIQYGGNFPLEILYYVPGQTTGPNSGKLAFSFDPQDLGPTAKATDCGASNYQVEACGCLAFLTSPGSYFPLSAGATMTYPCSNGAETPGTVADCDSGSVTITITSLTQSS